jgi:hypothetical protein
LHRLAHPLGEGAEYAAKCLHQLLWHLRCGAHELLEFLARILVAGREFRHGLAGLIATLGKSGLAVRHILWVTGVSGHAKAREEHVDFRNRPRWHVSRDRRWWHVVLQSLSEFLDVDAQLVAAASHRYLLPTLGFCFGRGVYRFADGAPL